VPSPPITKYMQLLEGDVEARWNRIEVPE